MQQKNDNILDAKDDGTNGHEIVVANGQCIDRVCVKDGMLTIRYLHPTDSGKYICEAKSKYGKDQRQVHLTVKVICFLHFRSRNISKKIFWHKQLLKILNSGVDLLKTISKWTLKTQV